MASRRPSLALLGLLAAALAVCCGAFLLPPQAQPSSLQPPHHASSSKRPSLARRPAVLDGLWESLRGGKGQNASPGGPPAKKELNAACKAKALEFGRGATTAPALIAFLKAQAAKDKKGPTVDEMVEAAAALVSNGSKRALLLSTYRNAAGAAQAAKLTKFTSAPSSPGSVGRKGAGSSSSSSGGRGGDLIAGKYRLEVGSSARISSGKSVVVDAVCVGQAGKGKGKGTEVPVKAKLSRNLPALRREADNLALLKGCKSVIGVLDFLENYDGRGGHALMLEAGEEDLVGLVRREGAQGRGEIKRICAAALDVLGALERRRLVWTDLRAANFVRLPGRGQGRAGAGGGIRAIDLESAVPYGERPVDCTPEVTPPEVARLYVAGQLSQARVDPAYDVWSLGCLVLFLASGGKTLFHGQPPNKAMLGMATLTPEAVQAELQRLVPGDARTRDFLKRVLVVDPRKRPTLGAVRRDLYLASPL